MKQDSTLETKHVLDEILRNLGVPEELLRDDVLLYRDLQLDSTEIVEISLALKRKLGISIKLESRQDKTLAEVKQAINNAQSE